MDHLDPMFDRNLDRHLVEVNSFTVNIRIGMKISPLPL